MRVRIARLLSLALAAMLAFPLAPVHALGTPVTLAQNGGGGGSSQEGGGGAEVGPPWTYQMARITVVLLVLLGIAIGILYYRLVVRRRRGEL